MPSGVAESDVVSRIFEVVDTNEPAPPNVISVAPAPKNRCDTQIFASSITPRSTSRIKESVGYVADI